MIDLHLLREELFQPFIFLDVIVDELDGQLSVNLYSSFTGLASIEPRLCPPAYAALIGIDTDESLDIETLDVYLQFSQRIYESATGYCPVFCFFFSRADIVLRKTW